MTIGRATLFNLVYFFYLHALPAQNQPFSSYVNPFVGTDAHGHTFPGATLPFAMVQLSPDTRTDGSWDGCSGYHFSDSLIRGFSHTHLSGTGCSDYGDIAFLPIAQSNPAEANQWFNSDIALAFSHQNELATAGYYQVLLNNRIKVELTSSLRVGFQKYSYPSQDMVVMLNLNHRDKLLEGKIKRVTKKGFNGFRRSEAWAKDQWVYYHFELSREPDSAIWNYDSTKLFLYFFSSDKPSEVFIKTALSSVSEAGAKQNMDREIPHWDFEKVRGEAQNIWNEELKKIKVYGGSEETRVNFYTALYHCMIHPNLMSDADGSYRGRDGEVHQATDFNYYTVFSLWDTYRALHPLLNIIDKKRSADFIKTFQMQYEQGGRLPMWELWGNETDCMIGFHSVSVILDAFNKHVMDATQLRAIYPAIKAEGMSGRFGLDKFRSKGYLSVEDESESVSKTLEYSYDFYCISKIASLLNESEDETYFKNLSEGWRNVYNTKTGFMTPRKNGNWLTPFDPKRVDNNYTEANAWQYSFAVPQNYWEINTTQKLATLFNEGSQTTGRQQSDISGMIGQYAHGNEPSHHIPYLFWSQDSTEKYVKKIMLELYKPVPEGLCGNEDCGQMSAWYVLSSMGMYPPNPAANHFKFGHLLYDSVVVQSDHYAFRIFKDLKQALPYVSQSENSGEQPLTFEKSLQITLHKDTRVIAHGFDFVNREELREAPLDLNVVSPIIKPGAKYLIDSLKIEMYSNSKVEQKLKQIYYQLNGQSFQRYEGPFFVKKNTTIKAFEKLDTSELKRRIMYNHLQARASSDTSFAKIIKKPNSYAIKILNAYNPEYTANGDEGIIDGEKGDIDWRKGGWQGYQGMDFEAIVDLKRKTLVSSLGANFLQDTRSWILMPREMIVESSLNGKDFKFLGKVSHDIEDSDYLTQTRELILKIKPTSARYIKFKAVNYGKLPDWHAGAGGEAFIFIDEIRIGEN